nr:hypothetical protein [Tanacetum cinerariifolium]
MFDCDDYFTSESDESFPPSPIYDRYHIGDGYHVVPPPYTGTFMPPKPDLVFHIAPNDVETVHTAFNVELSPTKPDNDLHVVPAPVLTHSKLVPINAVRPVTTAVPKPSVTRPRHSKTIVTKPTLPPRRHINRSPSPKASNFPPKVTAVKAPMGNPRHALKDTEVIDSGCSRHMKGNMSYLSDFEELNGGYVAFGSNPKGGKISRKGKIMTGKLDFDDVYFVKELKFNLFSISQMCDKKNSVLFTDTECLVLSLDFKLPDKNQNSVLFTDTECLVLSPDFKLPDESQLLLRVPREKNMYNVSLKNIVPSGDLTSLFAKPTTNESNLWHRRLGHINFKTINNLVKGNLVRGLPTKVFENENTCVACKKCKQHRASCKTKPVSSVDQPLFRLHMDLFGPTFVKSLNKKSYCLVVTDDYSRFNWVFFLATKDETSPILKTFIIGLENQLSLKVKVLRSDNGTEFKNSDLNQFCGMKGIKREFNSLLPILFWAEAVNTACYVHNRVLVTKPHNKAPYELLHGKTPSIGFMGPFGCSVTIFNTLDSLEKAREEIDQQYVIFPVWSSGSTNPQNYDGDAAFDGKELKKDQEKHKIGSKRDKNGKRGEAGRSEFGANGITLSPDVVILSKVMCLLMDDLDLVTVGWACLGRVTMILGIAALTGLTTVLNTGLD